MQTCIGMIVCLLWFAPVALQGPAHETAGVGIALRKDGDYLVMNALSPDAPAAASKAIHVGDRIIAVAQGDGPDVPVKGWGIIELSRLVRGPKGTTVRLTILPARKLDREAYVVSCGRSCSFPSTGETRHRPGLFSGALVL
jgi:C-terminal processing protease CtpA/Prc